MKYLKKMSGYLVYLSPVNPEDFEISAKWMNDREVAENLSVFHRQYSFLKEKQGLAESALDNYSFAIVRKEDDRLIGFCAFYNVDMTHQRAEFYIYLGEAEFRKKGFGRDALLTLLRYGFCVLNFNNIMLRVLSFNEAAFYLYESVGFKIMGRRRESFYKNGTYFDEIYMDMTKKDFFEKGTVI